MLTPEDLKNKTFSKGFRGYEVEEVDKFLKTLLKEYEYLYLDNLEQKETIERVSSKLEYYQQMEATMQSTLTVAQETADELKASSEKKAALLEKETTVKCEQQLSEAKAAAQKIHDDTMLHAEDLYNKTKAKTDNMLQAAQAECEKLREEAKAYADQISRRAEMEAEKLRMNVEDTCKKRANAAASDANKLLTDARNEAGKMMLEANTKYRKIVGDAEERSRKMIFEADAKVATAEQEYNAQLKKAALHRKNMLHLLETQVELLKNFNKQDEE
ncbi:DivIVA domain-containing protein [Phascolarctobacterium sp.]